MSNSNSDTLVYGVGQDKTLISSLLVRTVDNSAAYLKHYIQPHMKILDVGCGPGTMTVDFAKRVPQGYVVGLDTEAASATLEKAKALSKLEEVLNVTFITGDTYALPFSDDSFDITHCHQILQHLQDPIQVLREMKRVTKPGGFVACRDMDRATLAMIPMPEILQANLDMLNRVTKDTGCEGNSGHHLHIYARRAGFDPAQTKVSASTWSFRTREERRIWANMFIGIRSKSELASVAIRSGYVTKERLKAMVQAWKDWIDEEEGFATLLNVEIICRV